jgi:uroporphyrinogen-III synthase
MSELAGRNIVITRPAAQSEKLAALIRTQGGNAIVFPTLEIVPLENRDHLLRIFASLRDFDFAIFISANAVTCSLPLLREAWPKSVRAVAIGSATESALRSCGINDILLPAETADSEHLLARAELKDVDGKRIVIFRGEGGRELLKETLLARGASVEYAECYRRVRPATDPRPLIELWSRNEMHAIVVASVEALRNLFAMLPDPSRDAARDTPIFVPHSRIAEAASELGCGKIVTTEAGDEGMVRGLAAWFGTRI